MNNYLITNPFRTEVKDMHGRVTHRSKNLRAMTRYASESPVKAVRAYPCPSNPHNGRLIVVYRDGASSCAFFSSYTVMLEWLERRRKWQNNLTHWDIDGPTSETVNQRNVHALERLAKKGLY